MEVLQRHVQVVLVHRLAVRGQRRGVQGADLGLDLVAELPRVLAEAQERLLDRRRHLPGDAELGVRLSAELEVAADRSDQRAVDPGRRGAGQQLGTGRGGEGRRTAECTADGDGAHGHRAGAQHPTAGEAGPQVLVLLGHAHAVGKLGRHAHVGDIHARDSVSGALTAHGLPVNGRQRLRHSNTNAGSRIGKEHVRIGKMTDRLPGSPVDPAGAGGGSGGGFVQEVRGPVAGAVAGAAGSLTVKGKFFC